MKIQLLGFHDEDFSINPAYDYNKEEGGEWIDFKASKESSNMSGIIDWLKELAESVTGPFGSELSPNSHASNARDFIEDVVDCLLTKISLEEMDEKHFSSHVYDPENKEISLKYGGGNRMIEFTITFD